MKEFKRGAWIYFTRQNAYWSGNEELDELFIKLAIRYSMDVLRAKGYFTLEELKSRLGDRTGIEDLRFGWSRDKGDTEIEYTLGNGPENGEFVISITNLRQLF